MVWNSGNEFHTTYREAWNDLPESVKNYVRLTVLVAGLWCFVGGFLIGWLIA